MGGLAASSSASTSQLCFRDSNKLFQNWRCSASFDVPSPRRAACAVAAADGRSLWVVCGNDGCRSLGDVYNFNLEASSWAKVHRFPRSFAA